MERQEPMAQVELLVQTEAQEPQEQAELTEAQQDIGSTKREMQVQQTEN